MAQRFSAGLVLPTLSGFGRAGKAYPVAKLIPNTGGRNLKARIYVSDIFAHTELLAAPVFESASGPDSSDRTRPNLKVQDGCDNRCSFCVIPSVRGQSRSLPLPESLREVTALVAAGYRELVISGINLGRWGRDLETRSPGAALRKPEARSWNSRTSLRFFAPSSPKLQSKNSAYGPSSPWIGPTISFRSLPLLPHRQACPRAAAIL